MQRMFFELSNLNRQLDWIINHSIECSNNKGDCFDQICDDVTDARAKIQEAMKAARRNKGTSSGGIP